MKANKTFDTVINLAILITLIILIFKDCGNQQALPMAPAEIAQALNDNFDSILIDKITVIKAELKDINKAVQDSTLIIVSDQQKELIARINATEAQLRKANKELTGFISFQNETKFTRVDTITIVDSTGQVVEVLPDFIKQFPV